MRSIQIKIPKKFLIDYDKLITKVPWKNYVPRLMLSAIKTDTISYQDLF